MSNCYDALIDVLPWVIVSFSIKYWTIDIHGCDCQHISCDNENLRAIKCTDKSNIVAPLKHSRVGMWFHTTYVIPILSLFLYNKYRRGCKTECKAFFVHGSNDKTIFVPQYIVQLSSIHEMAKIATFNI